MESLTEDQIAEDLVEVLKKFLQKDHIPSPSKIVRYAINFITVGKVRMLETLSEPYMDVFLSLWVHGNKHDSARSFVTHEC